MTKYYLVLGGYCKVGKTTFLKKIKNDFLDEGIHVNVVKWNNFIFYDLNGDLKYRNYIKKYLNDGNIIIMCYRSDIEISFNSISSWLEEIKDKKGKKIILLDLYNKRTELRDEASFYCLNNGYFHYDLDIISEKEFLENVISMLELNNNSNWWSDWWKKICCF